MRFSDLLSRMLLREAEDPNLRRVVRAPRFDKEMKKVASGFRDVPELFADFIAFRRNRANDLKGWGKKDEPLTGVLAGYRHVHLHFGKVIVIYRYTQSTLYLLTVQNHIEMAGRSSGKQTVRLGDTLDAIFKRIS